MAPRNESQKLQAYQDALSTLPLEKQVGKMNAVTKPKTLRRFLSKEAPVQLVERFAHRVYETDCIPEDQLDVPEGLQPFSRYETARIYTIQGLTQLAIETLTNPILTKQPIAGSPPNPNAHDETLLLGELLIHQPNSESLGIQALEAMEQIGHKKPKPTLSLFEHYHDRNNQFTSDIIGKTVLADEEVSDDDKLFIQGVTLMNGNAEAAGVALLENLAERGNQRALDQLQALYDRTGDIPNLEKTILRQIQYGDVRMYINLAMHYVIQADFPKAIEACRASIKLEFLGGYDMLIEIYAEDLHDLKAAQEVAMLAMRRSGYPEPAIQLAHFYYMNSLVEHSQALFDETKSLVLNNTDPACTDDVYEFLIERAITKGNLNDIPLLLQAGLPPGPSHSKDADYLYLTANLINRNIPAALKRLRAILVSEGDLARLTAIKYLIGENDQQKIENYMINHLIPVLSRLQLPSLIKRLDRDQMN